MSHLVRPVSPDVASSVHSPHTRSNIPSDLENLTKIFHLATQANSTPEEVSAHCCDAVVRACREGGSSNLKKIEQSGKMLATIRDLNGCHPLTILRNSSEDQAAKLLSKVLIKEAKNIFAKEGNTEAFRAVLLPQLFDVYLYALETHEKDLLQACKIALGSFVSGRADDLRNRDPYFSHISQTLGKKLWEKGKEHKDSVLKAFCVMLYRNFETHRETVPPELRKLIKVTWKDAEVSASTTTSKGIITDETAFAIDPPILNVEYVVFTEPQNSSYLPRIFINENGLSSLHWQPLGCDLSPNEIAEFANIIEIEYAYIDSSYASNLFEYSNLDFRHALICKTLSTIPSLRSLEFSGKIINSRNFDEHLKDRPLKITSLTCHIQNVQDYGRISLEVIFSMFCNLTSLTIHFDQECTTPGVCSLILHALRQSPSLNELELHGPIDEKTIISILKHLKEGQKKSEKLKSLRIATDFQITNPSQECLVALRGFLSHNQQLEDLSLVSLNVGASSSEAAREFFKSLGPNIKSLQLSGNKSGNQVANLIPKGVFKRLSRLQLSANEIGNVGANELAFQIQHLPMLESLDLTNNQIEHQGLEAIAYALNAHPRAITVYLDGNPIRQDYLMLRSTALRLTEKKGQAKFVIKEMHQEGELATLNSKQQLSIPNKPLPKPPAAKSPSQPFMVQPSNKVRKISETQPKLSPRPLPPSPSAPIVVPQPSKRQNQEAGMLVDTLQALEQVIERTEQLSLTQPGDIISMEAILLQGLKELQTEQASLNVQVTSQEQLSNAQDLQLVLERDIAAKKQQLGDLGDIQFKIQEQMDAINRKLAQKCDIAEHQRLENDHKALAERSAIIKAQVDILMNEHAVKEQKRQALKKFQSDPNKLLYYRTILNKLEDFFISVKAVAGGFVPVTSGDLGIYQTILSVMGDVATIIPVIGNAAQKTFNIAGIIVGNIDQKRQINAALNASELLTLSEMKKFAESMARQLTENYEEQLQLLATQEEEQKYVSDLEKKVDLAKKMVTKSIHCPPAKQFAAFGIFWIIEEFCNLHQNDLKAEDLDRKLISTISRKTPPDKVKSFWQEITKKLNLEAILDKKGQKRHPEEFYTLSGIKTVGGEYYAGSEQKPAIFGWRIGTGEDAKMLGFPEVPVSADRGAKRDAGIKQAHLLVQDIQRQDGKLDYVEKSAHLRTDVVAGRVEELSKKTDRNRYSSIARNEKLEARIEAQAELLKAQAEQLKAQEALLKALQEKMETA